MARLFYPPNSCEIILCGVRRRALLHSSFVNDLLFEMQPQCTFLQFHPDDPLFIRPQTDCEDNYFREWNQFIRYGKDSRFYVSPSPKYTSDLILSNDRVKKLVNNSIKTAVDNFEMTPKVLYSPSDMKHASLFERPTSDAFLTPLLYSYNSLASTESNPRVIAVGDMPMLIQKELYARALTID